MRDLDAFLTLLLLALSLSVLGGCATTGSTTGSTTDSSGAAAGATAPATPTDPTRAEVPLPAAEGWRAALVIDTAPTGIWTVEPFQVFPQYACPELVGLDDLGRCHVMVGYSGKWTPVTTIADGTWLGGLAQGDVDPRVAGPELYTGGKKGNLYQVVAHREGVADSRRIAHLAGHEIHTLVVCDADPTRPGDELLAFTRPGGLWLLVPHVDRDGFDARLLEPLEGRVRDALPLPTAPGAPPEIATVERSGRLRVLTLLDGAPHWRTIHERPMGMGRLALRAPRDGEPLVLYSTCDDGTIWRHERRGDAWASELVYAGPQGPRGLAAGRFRADPDTETVAVFGYGRRVELLVRSAAGWTVETVFEDRDKGHWLAAAEVDGRNATDELVCSGYGGRIVLLARPAGYGLGNVVTAE